MSLQPEQVDHINIVNWFNYQFPELSDDFHHFANERKCSMQQGRLFKRMGVKKGVADFFLAVPIMNPEGPWYAGLWIELKVGKGKLSVEQSEFLYRKNEMGYMAIAVWGFDAAIVVINNYLKMFKQNSLTDEPKKQYISRPCC
jgi:hypothetical protein